MSYITMPAEKVRELATKCLKHVEARRKRNIEELCNDIRKPSWLERLFRVYDHRSDAEIVASIRLGGTGSRWSWALHFAQTDRYDAEEVAERLLKLAQYGDPVMVSGEDLELIT